MGNRMEKLMSAKMHTGVALRELLSNTVDTISRYAYEEADPLDGDETEHIVAVFRLYLESAQGNLSTEEARALGEELGETDFTG